MEQSDVARYALQVLDEMALPYAVVGSFASSAWGNPRMTRDIDIVVEIPVSRVAEFCRRFPADEWYVSETAAREAAFYRRQFNIIHTPSGNKIDVMIARQTEWARQQLQRRQLTAILPGVEGYLAHPEDVIIGKLLYFKQGGSDKHTQDISGMLAVSGELINPDNVAYWADKLGVGDLWQQILDEHDRTIATDDETDVPF